MTNAVVISGAGLWKPPHIITNEELVGSYNAYAERFNADHHAAIEACVLPPMASTSAI